MFQCVTVCSVWLAVVYADINVMVKSVTWGINSLYSFTYHFENQRAYSL